MEPRRGCPLHRTPYKRLRRPCRSLSPRAGCRGKSAPDTLPAGLGRSGRVRGRVLAPAGAGRTNPLTRPPTRKTRHRPAQGAWRGTVGVDGGQGSQRPRSSAALTPRNDPNAQGRRLGCSSPSRLPRGRNGPRRAAGGALAFDFLLLRFGGFGGGTPTEVRSQRNRPSEAQGGPFVYPGFRSEHDKRSLRKCALVPLREEASGAPERHPEGGLLVEHIQRVGSRSGASCGACWPPSITPLIPAFAIRFLRSTSNAAMWFRPLPRQPNSGFSR